MADRHDRPLLPTPAGQAAVLRRQGLAAHAAWTSVARNERLP